MNEMDTRSAFEAGWNCALGALFEKVLQAAREGCFDDVAVMGAACEIRDHLASLKRGADKEPPPELVNALRAYMSQNDTLDSCSVAPEDDPTRTARYYDHSQPPRDVRPRVMSRREWEGYDE